MSLNEHGLKPIDYAKELRFRHSPADVKLEPAALCGVLGIEYFEEDLGASGREAGALVRGQSGRMAVVVNRNIKYEGRKRFTASHEIGHATIPWHLNSEYWCVSEEIETYRPQRQFEREANEFASELLLPSQAVRSRLRLEPSSMSLAKMLADQYGTSLTATACKCVILSDLDKCAVAMSSSCELKWIVSSKALLDSATPILAKRPLHAGSLALASFQKAGAGTGPQVVPPTAWLAGWQSTHLQHILEEIVELKDLGLVLSFVTIPDEEEEG